MELRAAGVEATRERILAAAADIFLERWYDDVTLAEVAKHAGVSGQTVINHFGGKEQLATAAYEHLSKEITLRRYTPEPGDVEGAVEALVEDYEITGDAVIRMLALEEKVRDAAAAAQARPRWPPRMGRDHVPRAGARARAGRRHRCLHLEAPAPRPGAQPRRDGRGDPDESSKLCSNGGPDDHSQALPVRDHRRRRHGAGRHVGHTGARRSRPRRARAGRLACSRPTSRPPAPSTCPGTARPSARTSTRRA